MYMYLWFRYKAHMRCENPKQKKKKKTACNFEDQQAKM